MYDARSRYVADSVATASPARLLTMLYDRLLLDLDRAAGAFAAGDDAAPFVDHAQDVVSELMATLDVDAWDGADHLMSIYRFVLTELLHADESRVAGCRLLLEPLAVAWHEAAAALGGPPPAPAGAPLAAGVLGVG